MYNLTAYNREDQALWGIVGVKNRGQARREIMGRITADIAYIIFKGRRYSMGEVYGKFPIERGQ